MSNNMICNYRTKRELHLANSVQALKNLAKKDIRTIKSERLCKSAEKLFQRGQLTLREGDEETAYILFFRFVLIYKYLKKENNNKRYLEQRLGREYNTILEVLNGLETSLHNRYKEQKRDEIISPKIATSTPKVSNKETAISPSNDYITCNELYKMLDKKMDIIVLDVRCKEDFLKSSMKHSCCVNIPEEIIDSSFSANIVGKQVPEESIFQWNRRWDSSIIVLMDWASTEETVTGSKLNILRDILIHWDPKMVDSKPPVVLNGGYLEWLQIYPMLCTNPDVVHEVQNSALNDLLDLEQIEYPPEGISPVGYLEPRSVQPVVDRSTKPVMNSTLRQDKKVSEMTELRAKPNLKAEETMLVELQQKKEKLLEDQVALEKSKQELNEENIQLRKKLQSVNSARSTDENIRSKLLQEAREKKKNVLINSNLNNSIKARVSEFDKRIKSTGESVTEPGLTGLTNLGTTCYMNSIIQCYSNTRILHNFFVHNIHSNGEEFMDKFGDVSKKLRTVFLRLWSGHYKYISPFTFKAVVDCFGPKFKGGEQQDAHEFMISLNTWLHDELKHDVERALQVIWTPRQKSWVTSTEGKTSVILETFCGQQVNVISCNECKKQKEMFELFESLTLALPSQGFCTLEDCLNQYYSKQQIYDYNCQTCQSSKLVYMEMKLVGLPPVLVLCLKRFSEVFVEGQYNYVKNVVSVKYPLKNLNLFGIIYNLFAVVVHRSSGVTLDSGHYFAFIKHLWSGKWFRYDDECVTEINFNEALQPEDAYILFYQSEAEANAAKLDYSLRT